MPFKQKLAKLVLKDYLKGSKINLSLPTCISTIFKSLKTTSPHHVIVRPTKIMNRTDKKYAHF